MKKKIIFAIILVLVFSFKFLFKESCTFRSKLTQIYNVIFDKKEKVCCGFNCYSSSMIKNFYNKNNDNSFSSSKKSAGNIERNFDKNRMASSVQNFTDSSLYGRWKYQYSLNIPELNGPTTIQSEIQYFRNNIGKEEGIAIINGYVKKGWRKYSIRAKFKMKGTFQWNLKDNVITSTSLDLKLSLVYYFLNNKNVTRLVRRRVEREFKKAFLKFETSESKILSHTFNQLNLEDDYEGQKVKYTAFKIISANEDTSDIM